MSRHAPISPIYNMGPGPRRDPDERFLQIQYDLAKIGVLALRRDDLEGIDQEWVDQQIKRIRRQA